jgi:hypothetical protein
MIEVQGQPRPEVPKPTFKEVAVKAPQKSDSLGNIISEKHFRGFRLTGGKIDLASVGLGNVPPELKSTFNIPDDTRLTAFVEFTDGSMMVVSPPDGKIEFRAHDGNPKSGNGEYLQIFDAEFSGENAFQSSTLPAMGEHGHFNSLIYRDHPSKTTIANVVIKTSQLVEGQELPEDNTLEKLNIIRTKADIAATRDLGDHLAQIKNQENALPPKKYEQQKNSHADSPLKGHLTDLSEEIQPFTSHNDYSAALRQLGFNETQITRMTWDIFRSWTTEPAKLSTFITDAGDWSKEKPAIPYGGIHLPDIIRLAEQEAIDRQKEGNRDPLYFKFNDEVVFSLDLRKGFTTRWVNENAQHQDDLSWWTKSANAAYREFKRLDKR